MDEPFSGLDPVNATLLMDTLVDLKKQGRAILFSTHRMDQVEKLCDEIAIIYRGKLVLEGKMRDIKSGYPANRVHVHFSAEPKLPEPPGDRGVEALQRACGADAFGSRGRAVDSLAGGGGGGP